MGKPKPEDIAKDVGTNLDAWYKRNSDRIKLIDNLSLDCELCKTKEAKDLIKKEIDLSLKNLRTDVDKLNKQNETVMKDVDQPPPKDVSKKLEEIIDKKTTIFNKGGVKVKVKGKLDKGKPILILEGSF